MTSGLSLIFILLFNSRREFFLFAVHGRRGEAESWKFFLKTNLKGKCCEPGKYVKQFLIVAKLIFLFDYLWKIQNTKKFNVITNNKVFFYFTLNCKYFAFPVPLKIIKNRIIYGPWKFINFAIFYLFGNEVDRSVYDE